MAHGPFALRLPSLAKLDQRNNWVLANIGHELGLRLSIQVARPAATGWFSNQRAGLALVAQQLLEERNTHPRQSGNSGLQGTWLAIDSHHAGA